MNSPFGEIFLFLTDLAWKSRMTIPVLVTTVFLIMDIRLQIEINIQSGQVAAAELDQLDDSDDEDDNNDIEDYMSDGTNDDDENANMYMEFAHGIQHDNNDENTANRLRRSLGLS